MKFAYLYSKKKKGEKWPALALLDKDSGFYAISGVLAHSGYEYYNK